MGSTIDGKGRGRGRMILDKIQGVVSRSSEFKEAAAVNGAKIDIDRRVQGETVLNMPRSMMGKIIGKGGSEIKRLKDQWISTRYSA